MPWGLTRFQHSGQSHFVHILLLAPTSYRNGKPQRLGTATVSAALRHPSAHYVRSGQAQTWTSCPSRSADDCRRIFEPALERVRRSFRLQVYGYVVMPGHVRSFRSRGGRMRPPLRDFRHYATGCRVPAQARFWLEGGCSHFTGLVRRTNLDCPHALGTNAFSAQRAGSFRHILLLAPSLCRNGKPQRLEAAIVSAALRHPSAHYVPSGQAQTWNSCPSRPADASRRIFEPALEHLAGNSVPQRLKPDSFASIYGTSELVPFPIWGRKPANLRVRVGASRGKQRTSGAEAGFIWLALRHE